MSRVELSLHLMHHWLTPYTCPCLSLVEWEKDNCEKGGVRKSWCDTSLLILKETSFRNKYQDRLNDPSFFSTAPWQNYASVPSPQPHGTVSFLFMALSLVEWLSLSLVTNIHLMYILYDINIDFLAPFLLLFVLNIPLIPFIFSLCMSLKLMHSLVLYDGYF